MPQTTFPGLNLLWALLLSIFINLCHPAMAHISPPNWKRSLRPGSIDLNANARLTSSDVYVMQQEAQA